MTISVVITHFYAERRANLPPIVSALLAGTVVPDEILIWNNEAPLDPLPPPVRVIQAPRNIGAKARFLAAMCATGDHVMFHDNDVAVQRRTIENMRARVPRAAVVALEGRRLAAAAYLDSQRITGDRLDEPVAVDVSLGRLEMVRRSLVNLALSRIPFEDATVMDDLWFSAAAEALGIPRLVIPWAPPDEGYALLPEHGVGSCVGDPGRHYAERDELCARLFGRAGRRGP